MMSSPVKFSTFFMGKLKKGCMFRKEKSMDLLSFMSSFKRCKNFPQKINFSECNFLEVYAVAHYTQGSNGNPGFQVRLWLFTLVDFWL